jgi:hypothetical protein
MPRPKFCRQCGADRAPNATYCEPCKTIRRRTQNRDNVRSLRARTRAQERERQEAERRKAAELEANERADRRRDFLRKHGMR